MSITESTITRQAGPRPLVYNRTRTMLDGLLADIERNHSSEHQIPSEAKLTDMFKCSRVTIRRVLESFERKGRIQRLPGRGTFLVPAKQQKEAILNPRIAWYYPLEYDEEGSVFGSRVLETIRKYDADKNRNLKLHLMEQDLFPSNARDLEKWAHKVRADVIILQPPEYDDPESLAYFKIDIPVVFFNRSSPFPDSISSVRVDHYEGIKRAMELLMYYGHRRIAYIGTEQEDVVTKNRVGAFRKTLEEHRIPEMYPLCAASLFSGIFEHVRSLMLREYPPTAIITGGGSYDWPCCQALTAANVRVPKEVSFLAIDEFPQAQHQNPPVSVLRQPIELLVEHAVELARERVASPDSPPRQVTLYSDLILRKTIGPAKAKG